MLFGLSIYLGDMGDSIAYRQPVSVVIGERFTASFTLSCLIFGYTILIV